MLLSNKIFLLAKKNFLLFDTMENATVSQQDLLKVLLQNNASDKISKMQQLYKDCKADSWALQLKSKYLNEALAHLDDIAVLSKRKKPLQELAHYLISREI